MLVIKDKHKEKRMKSDRGGFKHFEPGEVEWYPGDTEEVFLATDDEHRKKWEDIKFTYNINSFGFRSKEVEGEERESITVIGCSHTFGVGMPEEATWPALLSKKLNLPVHNFAQAGGSLDSAFRIYNEWQPIVKSKATFLFLPPGIRYEIIQKDNWSNLGTWVLGRGDFSDDVNDMLAKSLFDDNLYHVNKERNLAAIENVARKTESDLFTLRSDVQNVIKNFPRDRARDNRHYGFEANESIAQFFYEQYINEKET